MGANCFTNQKQYPLWWKLFKMADQKLSQLQAIEQNMQAILAQKQNIQSQLIELDNALNELKKNPKTIYKIVGPLMILSSQEEAEKELKSKKELLDVKLKSLEKQEEAMQKQATELQSEVLKSLKSKENGKTKR